MRLFWTSVIFSLFLIFSCLFSSEAKSETQTEPQPTEVIKHTGNYKSSGGKCPISLVTSEMGGFIQLILPFQREQKHIIDDVTGVAYLSDNLLVYTVSPVYGRPGVYLYDCLSKHIKRIASPKTKNKGYPNGADYYELQDWRESLIRFYYAPDVDSIDFSKFRTDDFLYEVHSDGSKFKKMKPGSETPTGRTKRRD
jgi:hypothetical protein